jgi:hypothetical protein
MVPRPKFRLENRTHRENRLHRKRGRNAARGHHSQDKMIQVRVNSTVGIDAKDDAEIVAAAELGSSI